MLERITRREDVLVEWSSDTEEQAPYPHHPLSFDWYRHFKEFGVLPFAGGIANQEQWILDDFRFFDRWTELEKDIPELKRMVNKRISELRNEAMDGYNN